MADEKKGCVFCDFFSKIFGSRKSKSSCCSMKIEEVAEDQRPQAPQPPSGSSCCGQNQAMQGQK